MVQAMSKIDGLLTLVDSVVAGAELRGFEVENIKYEADDPVIQKQADRLWIALRRYSDDYDIRMRDNEYSQYLKGGLSSRAIELRTLLSGADPNRRRSPLIARFLWKLGIIP